MAGGISLNIGANTREAVRGAKDIGDALEDVADSLDDVAKDSVKSGDKLESAFDGARKETAKVERSFRDLADSARKESKSAGDDIGRNVKRGADDATEGVKEIGRESASTAKESAASFDGSAASIGDAFQEIAANAFAGFGPAGLLAGVAAAAGIGVVFSAMEAGKEETEEFREAVGELTSELIEAGDSGAPSLDYIVDKLKELATASEDGADSLKSISDEAKGTGSRSGLRR
jgi:ABC-type transporter Mla subunit MlaD